MFRLLIITLYVVKDDMILLVLFIQGLAQSQNVEFDQDYVGVTFEPYTKYHQDYYDYTMSEVENMLEIVTSRFKWVSTYGMGTTRPNGHWNQGQASGLSAVAASLINNKTQSLKLIVNIGAWHEEDDQIMKREIANAFSAAEVANSNYPGTAKGVMITANTNTNSESQMTTIAKLLKDNVPRARNASLRLGLLASGCDTLSASLSDVESPLHDPILKVLESLDFIICHKVPSTASENVPAQVQLMGEYFLQVEKEFRAFKPTLIIIGATGWASYDKGRFSTEKSVKYWLEMGQWARKNQFRVDMYEAFDEPWRVELGADEHYYGWWIRVKNDTTDKDAFQEKIDYIPAEISVDHTLEIVLGTLGSMVFLAMLSGLVFLYQKLIVVKKQLLTKADIEEFKNGIKLPLASDDNTEDALRLPYDRRYEIPRRKLMIDTCNLLGRGAFGSVYKGKIAGQNDDIAFKMTQPNSTTTSLKSLLSEIKIMIHVGKHPNVVSIIGACTEDIKRGRIMIAIELCMGGCLQKRLRDYKEKLTQTSASEYQNTDSQSRFDEDKVIENCIQWSYEIASGMEYIASKNIIHADLATRNVLLTVDGTAKITDFGLSRRLYEYTNYVKQNQEPLPWRWMAIESLKTMTFSTKSDVWSYAVTLFEIFSLGDTPYPGLSWTVGFANVLENGLRMDKPILATADIYSMMRGCWNYDPAKRPSFSNLATFFNSLQYELANDIL